MSAAQTSTNNGSNDAPVVSALQNLVAAWEVLPNGNYSPRCIEDWLARDMKPAVDAARAALASAREVQP